MYKAYRKRLVTRILVCPYYVAGICLQVRVAKHPSAVLDPNLLLPRPLAPPVPDRKLLRLKCQRRHLRLLAVYLAYIGNIPCSRVVRTQCSTVDWIGMDE